MTKRSPPRISTGTAGLDEILYGGLVRNRSYLVRGDPGTGKTILGMTFLTEGVENDETALYINLEEAEDDIRMNARSVGIDLGDVSFLDLSPESSVFAEDQSYDIFAPDEVEQDPLAGEITDRVEELEPDRVFIDPLTKLRYLTGDEYQFRKQVVSFMRYLRERDATVLFTSQDTADSPDEDLQFLSDGTIELARGEGGRTLSVPKFRGSDVQQGTHAVRISSDGLSVYPELRPDDHDREYVSEPLSSGVPQFDELLHGGIERGTVTIISGPTGVGKTTVGTQFIKEAAGRGERSVLYLFEESKKTLLERSEAIDVPVEAMLDQEALNVEQVEPLNHSAEEFADKVRTEVEERDASIVMLDGIQGYKLALRGSEDDLVRKLHMLGRYLKNMGVTVVFVDEVSGVTGEFQATESDISYLADNIVVFQHVEVQGELHKAVGVIKKRTSDFERTLRKFDITSHGVRVGEPLTELRGILSGTPEWVGDDEERETFGD
ncbi:MULTISPECIES: ATPase domain-containing protein [Halorussus]|uniref:ATPase domain-containing protein n=1 Tax=Halorussus TaxID=1070314 RepID=UPI00209FB241|nr:ATPase domain-containing protein [Halorussus vallis]USZ78266.1 AAA family ATPase [Halorussus vallis]